MGRHRKTPVDGGKIIPQSHTHSGRKDVEARIGLTKRICSDCNARNAERAEKCRKCGCKNLRKKASQYRNS